MMKSQFFQTVAVYLLAFYLLITRTFLLPLTANLVIIGVS